MGLDYFTKWINEEDVSKITTRGSFAFIDMGLCAGLVYQELSFQTMELISQVLLLSIFCNDLEV